MDEFVSLIEESLRIFECRLKAGKVIRFHFTDESLRVAELATHLPPALRLIEGLRRGEYAQKFIDLALRVCCVERYETERSDQIAFESSGHVW